MIWGMGLLLVAFSMTLFIDGYARFNTRGISVILTYDNGVLVSGISNGQELNISGFSAPPGGYSMDVSCSTIAGENNSQTDRCFHTYSRYNSGDEKALGLTEYIMATILAMFAILSFYMAHRMA